MVLHNNSHIAGDVFVSSYNNMYFLSFILVPYGNPAADLIAITRDKLDIFSHATSATHCAMK